MQGSDCSNSTSSCNSCSTPGSPFQVDGSRYLQANGNAFNLSQLSSLDHTPTPSSSNDPSFDAAQGKSIIIEIFSNLPHSNIFLHLSCNSPQAHKRKVVPNCNGTRAVLPVLKCMVYPFVRQIAVIQIIEGKAEDLSRIYLYYWYWVMISQKNCINQR